MPAPAIAPSLEVAFEEAARHSPFLSAEWFENFIRTVVAPPERVYLLAQAVPDNGVSAVLPLRGPPQRSWLGDRLEGLSNFYSPLFGPVTDYGAADLHERVGALVARVAAENWALVDLHPLEAEMAPVLAGGFRDARWWVQRYFCFGNWYLPLEGMGFSRYMSTRPARLRNTLRRRGGRFRSAGGTLEVVSDRDGLRRCADEFLQVYARSWKRAEPFPGFIPGLVETLGERGWVRIGVARLAGAPAAAQIWILANGVAYIYKLAHDTGLGAYSPGSLLTARMMEQAIEVDRVEAVDFLMGDEAYKRDWMTHRRERLGILAFNPRTARGVAAAARHIGGRGLARTLRRLRGRTGLWRGD